MRRVLSRGYFMECFTPMVRYYQEVLPEKRIEGEKYFQKIIPRSEVFERLTKNENYLSIIQEKNKKLQESGSNMRYQLIPCRHCFACQLKYSAEWATRLVWESQYHEHKYYLTITYNEENVPLMDKMMYTDKEGHTIEYENDGTWSGTLKPEDITAFIKKIRYETGEKGIKYFYCGEYGSEGGKHYGEDGRIYNSMGYRPHYHMILFGAPLDVKQFYDYHIDSKHKKLHWKSKELDDWWGNKGFIDVAEVEWNNCAYVARYCMKKINFDNDPKEYAKVGKIPEFIRMSRRPGIATRYYEENKEKIYENDEVIQKTIQGKVSSFKPPAAFDKKLKAENPEMYELIKQSRMECAERNRMAKAELTKGISDLELLQRSAEKTITKGNMLKRIVDFD